jgi:hypothetical protein
MPRGLGMDLYLKRQTTISIARRKSKDQGKAREFD